MTLNCARTIRWAKRNRTKRDFFRDGDGRARIRVLPLPEPYTASGKRHGKSILLFDRRPSFRPDLRRASAVAHSGGQGWPVFGPPRQRRIASLSTASTAACSIASGTDPHQADHQKARTRPHQRSRSRSEGSISVASVGWPSHWPSQVGLEAGWHCLSLSPARPPA